MTTYNNKTFEGTITKGCTPQIIGRVIGIRGTGIRRITNKIRTDFHGSRPFIRADRDTNSFTLSTRGDNGLRALKAMAAIVTAEIDWITNGTGTCPHPMIDVPEPTDKDLNKHIIGTSGIFLRNITDRIARGEHGPGCFIIHKPDLGCYRIEGINQAQVQLGEKRLRAHIDQVIATQNPTRIDLDGTRAPPPTPVADTSKGITADTNSFVSLVDSSSDEEGESEGEEEDESKKTSKQTSSFLQAALPRPDTYKNTLEWNRNFNNAKNELAVAKYGTDGWHQVKDQEVLAYMNSKTTTETSKPSVRNYDTSSCEEFPAVLPNKNNNDNIKLKITTGAWANGPGMASVKPTETPKSKPIPRPLIHTKKTTAKPTAVTHIPLEPSTPPHIPPAPTRPPKMERQFTCLPPSLQQAASNCSSDEQARIAECISAAASAFDGPCFDEQNDDEQPFKGFIDGPHSFRNWDESSSDDSSDDEF